MKLWCLREIHEHCNGQTALTRRGIPCAYMIYIKAGNDAAWLSKPKHVQRTSCEDYNIKRSTPTPVENAQQKTRTYKNIGQDVHKELQNTKEVVTEEDKKNLTNIEHLMFHFTFHCSFLSSLGTRHYRVIFSKAAEYQTGQTTQEKSEESRLEICIYDVLCQYFRNPVCSIQGRKDKYLFEKIVVWVRAIQNENRLMARPYQ